MDLSNSQSLLHYRTQISTTILQTLRQREGGTWREREGHGDRQTDRQPETDTETDTDRHRHTETQTETELENFILQRSRFIQKPV